VDPWYPKPWMLPLIVLALIAPTFAGFAIGGTALGTALGAATLAAVVVIAARSRPREAIEFTRDGGEPLIAVALAPIDDARTANRIATLAEVDGEREGYSVLVLAPSQSTRTQRWFSDEGPGRVAAQERLAVSLATLAAGGCHAEGRVVSQDPAQALEDAAAEYGASRIAFVVSGDESDALIAELTDRLDRPVHRIEAETPGGPA
jgi:hypothetical protein